MNDNERRSRANIARMNMILDMLQNKRNDTKKKDIMHPTLIRDKVKIDDDPNF